MEPRDEDSTELQWEDPAWLVQLEGQWKALRRRALGLDPGSQHKMSELGEECQTLAAVAAWYRANGNITRASKRLGTSRRALRKRIVKWLKDNPTPLAAEASRTKACKQKGEEQPRRIEDER